MKKLNKKGFTIVELVIVIAVIGILAGVLIPTFTIVVRKANESAAMQALETARKEYMTEVDATADDFADFDKNYAYGYTVDKKGQTIEKLQGVYAYANGAFAKVSDVSAYEAVYTYTKATAYAAGTTYYNADGVAQTIADEAAFNGAGDLYTRGAQSEVQGVKIYKKVA